ncbi:nucleotide exchange factor GrpE [Bosea sp. UC22_33]|uniref:nucleotide exchange factor GrpE n=1 Tax=Bosea sp. UC22_33 TaxID=3350165 RepID=UPI00366D18D4
MVDVPHGHDAAESMTAPPKAACAESAAQASPGPLQSELADTRDKLLRSLAEQQNIRQQMQRQREEAVKFAASQLAGDLVDTLDNLRRAIESVPPDAADHASIGPLLKGVQNTESNLLATLARHGMQRIHPLGAAFDPHVHHAIIQRPDETAADGTVVEVLQPGYTLHDRVLRPAMVGVAVRGKRESGPAAG